MRKKKPSPRTARKTAAPPTVEPAAPVAYLSQRARPPSASGSTRTPFISGPSSGSSPSPRRSWHRGLPTHGDVSNY
jgi:hypothetical protein